MGLKLGIEDPEQWLECCPERVLDNWMAYYRLEPFGMESELLSKIAGLLFFLCSSKGVAIDDIEKFVSVVSKCQMPSNWIGQNKQEKLTTDELRLRYAESQKQAEKAFG